MRQRNNEVSDWRKKLIKMVTIIMVGLTVAQAIICHDNPLVIVMAIVHLVSTITWCAKAYKDPHDDERIHPDAGLKMIIIAVITTTALCVAILVSEELEFLRFTAVTLLLVGIIAELREAMNWPDQELAYVHLVFLGAVLFSAYFTFHGNSEAGLWIMVALLVLGGTYWWKTGSSGGSSIAIMLYLFGATIAGIIHFVPSDDVLVPAIATAIIGFVVDVGLISMKEDGRL